MADFSRPRDGYRFKFGGVKTNAVPDALTPDKYPYAQNVRALQDTSAQTRPGQVLKFSTDGNAITDIRAYTGLGTDNKPRFLARTSLDGIWLDNSVKVGTLAGGGSGLGAVMIPFRPNQSPVPYMYIANGSDYQKFSAPSASNAVIAQKVGIKEPQTPPDAAPDHLNAVVVTTPSAGWTLAGTAFGATDSPQTDTAVAVFADPASVSPSLATRYSVQIGGQPFITGQYVTVAKSGGGNVQAILQDVLPAIDNGNTLTIRAIAYFSGSTGRCVIVPAQMPSDMSVPTVQDGDPSAESIYGPTFIGSLRRGCLIQLVGEVVFVLNAVRGPDGTISFECVTTNNHVAGETMNGLPAIVISFPDPPASIVGQTITAPAITFNVNGPSSPGTGIGGMNLTFATSPFIQAPFLANPKQPTTQEEDYIQIGLLVSGINFLRELKINFDVGDGSFTQNAYFYTVRPNDIQGGIQNNLTQIAVAQIVEQRALVDDESAAEAANQGTTASSAQLNPGDNQWSSIRFQVKDLTRMGGDETRSLVNCGAVQILAVFDNIQASIAVPTVRFRSLWIGNGQTPDVGDVGSPLFYRVRPRSSVTGARGNPSPATRYGVSPRRQQVIVSLPSASYDSQIDTWDIFRYGGSIIEWRYVGQTASSSTTYVDNFSDEAVGAGDVLDFDNFEPWPSVDVPLNTTATSVTGTLALVTIPSPTNALSFLPGTLVQIGGQNVYTLWARPTLVSGTTYLFQFIENAGALSGAPVSINEPLLANQKLPYMWGPDAAGTVFAVGDPLRLGSVYFSKNNDPDSVPDTYNIEITSPSEPLLGGEVLDGLSYVASPESWWALIPNFGDHPAERYTKRLEPIPRGLAAPYGIATDGNQIFFWAKDGIWSTSQGSLTDADLYNLFPHEGVLGKVVTYNGKTINPPDYSRAGTFRLAYANYYLYATYQDSGGVYRCLTLDVRRMAWCPDVYSPQPSVFYHPEQQAGTLLTSTSRYDEVLMGTTDGRIAVQTDLSNDLNGAIPCTIATFEWDGGDVRAPVQWGDIFVDTTSPALAGISVRPVSLSAAIGSPLSIATSASRVRQPLSVGGLLVSDFMGLEFDWTDDFTSQSGPTILHVWQPSYVIQPAFVIAWQTLGSAFGIEGYFHIRQIAFAWISTAPITITITTFDGTSPQVITIPSSAGAYQKQMFPLSFNKGLLYKFQASSAQKFQLFMDDTDLYVGAWHRDGAYAIHHHFDGNQVADGTI